MPTSWMRRGALVGMVVLGLGLVAWSAGGHTPTPAEILSFKPIQKGVVYSTPDPKDWDKCKVELMEGTTKGSSGWVLRDPRGQILRKFFDSNGDKYPDMWSYYKDGLEVYREVDANFNGKADKYVWLNSGGMKVGLDKNEDGIIDQWLALSPEELSQEVVKAFATKDIRYLEAVLVTDDDLHQLGAPTKEIARIREMQKTTAVKFRQTLTKLGNLNENTRWQHLETGAPSRLPAESTGMKHDVLMYYRGLILCETSGKHDWIQLGEMVLVGEAWKLIDAPLPGDAQPTAVADAGNGAPAEDPVVKELSEKLTLVDAKPPVNTGTGPNPAVVAYHLQRADLLEQLVARTSDADRVLWVRQMVDSLCAAVQFSQPGDNRAMDKLGKWVAKLGQEKPLSEAAPYAAFRALSIDYTMKVAAADTAQKMLAVQTQYQENLIKFLADYSKADDSAEALLELGKLAEYIGKDKEAEAKKWYEQLVGQFPTSKQAVKANGALRRFGLEGKVWEISAPVVSLGGPAFAMEKLRGKFVVVYYWMSWCESAPAEFAKMRKLATEYAGKVEFVVINVDDMQNDAEAFLRKNAMPGYQLYSAGGLDSPLATHYGLVSFPYTILVGKDGKVVNRSIDVLNRAADVANLEDELKKVVK